MATSKPDGYQIGYAPGVISGLQYLVYSNVKPEQFEMIMLAVTMPAAITVRADSPYQNINDPKAIVPLIIGKVLTKTTIGQLANINPAELFSKYAVGGSELGKLGLDSFSSVGKSAVAIGSNVTDTAKKAADDLKKLLKF
mgnify:CR=1 FL=1